MVTSIVTSGERTQRALQLIESIKLSQRLIGHIETAISSEIILDYDFIESITIEKKEIADMRKELEELYALSF